MIQSIMTSKEFSRKLTNPPKLEKTKEKWLQSMSTSYQEMVEEVLKKSSYQVIVPSLEEMEQSIISIWGDYSNLQKLSNRIIGVYSTLEEIINKLQRVEKIKKKSKNAIAKAREKTLKSKSDILRVLSEYRKKNNYTLSQLYELEKEILQLSRATLSKYYTPPKKDQNPPWGYFISRLKFDPSKDEKILHPLKGRVLNSYTDLVEEVRPRNWFFRSI